VILGAVADDFTGASDLANTLARGGMRTVQFVGPGDPVDCEAGVVALKTRSVPAAEAVARSSEAARWLLAQGCRQILFKYCSTFDSTPQGNIGPVAEALLELTGAEVALVCPAFPRAGRRLYRGHLFVGERLLNESGMETHPLTPMTDPDLRRWLRMQTSGDIGHLPLETVRAGTDAIAAHLAAERADGRRLIVADAVEDADLLALGAAAAEHALVTGGSGIALGLPENFRRAGRLSEGAADLPRPRGPGIVLSGSCSQATREQVRTYAGIAPSLLVEPEAVLEGALTVAEVADWSVAHAGEMAPMVFSTADPGRVAAAQARLGRERTAAALEGFFGDLAREMFARGTRRIVVGGGETSGAVVEALGLRSMAVGAEIAPGVPALFADRGGAVGLALKSGNFGGRDFFARALEAVGSP
jgi:3-dehydrotetronate 4-kinase